MQQGQTYILIVRFPDPNYGVKAVNENKLPSLIMSSPLAPLYISQRPLSFTFVSPKAKFYIPNRRKFSIYFKNKVNKKIGVNCPCENKRAKGCFGFYYKEMSF